MPCIHSLIQYLDSVLVLIFSLVLCFRTKLDSALDSVLIHLWIQPTIQILDSVMDSSRRIKFLFIFDSVMGSVLDSILDFGFSHEIHVLYSVLDSAWDAVVNLKLSSLDEYN